MIHTVNGFSTVSEAVVFLEFSCFFYDPTILFIVYYMLWCILSHVWLFATLWTVGHQAPLAMEFSRQEYWSGLPFSPLGDLPDPGLEPAAPVSPALAGSFFTTAPLGEPTIQWTLAIWSLVPLPFLNPACVSGRSQFMYYWSLAWRILSITLLGCKMSITVEKETAAARVPAWRSPGTGEPGGLRSMGSQSRTRLKRLSSSVVVRTFFGISPS